MPTIDGLPTIRNLLKETRRYPRPPEFAARANVDGGLWDKAALDPADFCSEQAGRLDWATPWREDHSWEPAVAAESGELSIPRAEWLAEGRSLGDMTSLQDEAVPVQIATILAGRAEPSSPL